MPGARNTRYQVAQDHAAPSVTVDLVAAAERLQLNEASYLHLCLRTAEVFSVACH